MQQNEEKWAASLSKFRQSMEEAVGRQRKTMRVGEDEKEVLDKRGKRLHVEKMQSFHEQTLSAPAGKGNITLYPSDIERLDEHVFLNDQIINFFTRQALLGLKPITQTQIHICDSLVYAELTRDICPGQGINHAILQRNVGKVVGWMRKTNGLQKPWVFIPVCQSLHWYLAVIANERGKSRIIFLDSIRHTIREQTTEILYRLVEAGGMVGQRITVEELKVNQQNNSFDCGVHLIHNVNRMLAVLATGLAPSVQALEQALEKPTISRRELKEAVLGNMQSHTPKPPTELQVEVRDPPPQMEVTNALADTAGPPRVLVHTASAMETDTEIEQQLQAMQTPAYGSLLIMRIGEEITFAPEAKLINTTNAIVELTEHTQQVLANTITEVRDTMQAYKQRKKKFMKNIDEQLFRFETTRFTGSVIIKFLGKSSE